MPDFIFSLEFWVTLALGFLLSIIGGIIVVLIYRKQNDPRIRIKEYSKSNSNDQEFYTQLKKAVRNCKKEVVQYAEGFDTRLPERYDVATDYIEDLKKIFYKRKDLRWIRYQTVLPEDKKWDKLLTELSKEFPRQFKVLPVNNKFGDHIMSIVLVDPGTKFSKSFFLVSNPVNIDGSEKVSIANASLIISGSKAYSNALRNQIELMYDRLQ
ncbi:MAG: hypothetical protein JXR05_17260 [Flavobacteriaceae bacterium]